MDPQGLFTCVEVLALQSLVIEISTYSFFILMKDISLEPKITNLSGLLPSAPWSAFISYKKQERGHYMY